MGDSTGTWPASVQPPRLRTETGGPQLDSFLVMEGAPLLAEELAPDVQAHAWHGAGAQCS